MRCPWKDCVRCGMLSIGGCKAGAVEANATGTPVSHVFFQRHLPNRSMGTNAMLCPLDAIRKIRSFKTSRCWVVRK